MKNLLSEISDGAGQLLLRHFRSGLVPREKADTSWVTDADLASESFILERLRRATPGARIIAEESGRTGGEGPVAWYVDPLDGTTNFARGIPLFVVSIAQAVDGELRHAAILHPSSGELFHAAAGEGAFAGDEPLRVASGCDPRRCVIATGDLYDRGARFEQLLDQTARVYEQVMAVRAIGSVALSLAYVAAGRLDGFFFDRCNSWDVAAGLLLVREAGGVALTFDGEPASLDEGGSVVAGNADIVAAMLSSLRR